MKDIKIFCFVVILFVLCGIILYSSIINSFFVADDFYLISIVKEQLPLALWMHNTTFFRPIISISLFIDYTLWGLAPEGYHITNILFHSLNSFLVFIVSYLLMNKIKISPQRVWYLSLLSGFLFLLLPCHTESTVWISGRTDLIATFFFLCSFIAYLYYKSHSQTIYLIVSLFFFICALCSKESVIGFPFIILSYGIFSYFSEEKNKKEIFRIVYIFLIYSSVLFLFIVVRYLLLGVLVGGYGGYNHLKVDYIDVLPNILFNFERTLLPPLSYKTISQFEKFLPLLTEKATLTIVYFIFVIIPIVVIAVKKISQKEIYYTIFFLLAAFLFSLVSVINLCPCVYDRQGERYIYLSSIFSSILLVIIVNFIVNTKKYLIASFIFVLLFFCFSTYNSITYWKEAGVVSKNIINSIKKLKSSDNLFIINAPTTINGSFIYLTGLREAVALFDPNHFKKVIIISYNKISSLEDFTIVSLKNINTYSIQLVGNDVWFLKEQFPFTTAYYDIYNFDNIRYDLKFKLYNNKEDTLAYYSKGEIVPFRFNNR